MKVKITRILCGGWFKEEVEFLVPMLLVAKHQCFPDYEETGSAAAKGKEIQRRYIVRLMMAGGKPVET